MKKLIRKVETRIMNKVLVVKNILRSNSGEGFVDSGIKILISVVIGALLLVALTALFSDTIMPGITAKITEMFNIN